MSVKILNASISSSLQDFGWKNYANIGIAMGGAIDVLSLKIANILLGNDESEAGLEIFLNGGSYEFLESHHFVLSGADFGAKLNNSDIQNCRVYLAKRGDILRLGLAKTGVCGYLCVRGGFKVKRFLGSKSSDFKMKVGIFEGRFLKSGDVMECEIPSDLCLGLDSSFATSLQSDIDSILYVQNHDEIPIIHIVLGPDDDAFTQRGIQTFLSTTYKVGAKSSRMAIMCESEAKIEHKAGADIISSPVTFGSIQVPKSGEPLVLMAGRQTSGGYTRIACVIESDLHVLTQIKLGTNFRFQKVSIQEAIALFNEMERKLEMLRERTKNSVI